MIDWTARIDDLAGELAREHSVEDRQAIEVLLAALVDCPRTPQAWVALETNWFARECGDGWFAFGGLWKPLSLRELAEFRWRLHEKYADKLNEEPHLFIEPHWRKYPRHSAGWAGFITERALRVRCRQPRSDFPIRSLDTLEDRRRLDRLKSLVKMVLDDPTKSRSADPPRFVAPPNLLYNLELVSKISPWFPDWRLLVRSLGALAIRHAYLFGRSETGPEENAILSRLASDAIPPWIVEALRMLEDGKFHKTAAITKAMGLEHKMRASAYGPNHELTRLRRAGIVNLVKGQTAHVVRQEHRKAIKKLLDGQAFEAAMSA